MDMPVGPRSAAVGPATGPPARPLPAVTAPTGIRPPAALLAAAHAGLAEAAATWSATDRYAASHLAALRAAAAVLAARARPAGPGGRRSRPTSVWTLLVAVAPELGEWAQFFAAGAAKRVAAEAGLARAVSDREADDLLRDAQTFLALAQTTLGVAHQELLHRPATCAS